MHYRVDTPSQLAVVLRSLRKAQHLNQAEAGLLIGVSQRRLAAIEASPGSTSFDQITCLVVALGGHVDFFYKRNDTTSAVEEDAAPPHGVSSSLPPAPPSSRSARSIAQDTW
jgi:HTH-type transcriptional regulator/antitoxin HipB